MAVTLNGHTYDVATNFTGADGYAYSQNNADTGLPNFPDSIFTDMLAELAPVETALADQIAKTALCVTATQNADTARAAIEAVTYAYDVGTLVPGFPGASQEVLRLPTTRAYRLPQNLTGSAASSAVAAAAQKVWSIKKNGTEVGTLTFALGATVATFTMASATDFTTTGNGGAPDILTIVAAAAADTTLSGVSVLLKGTLVP